MMQRLDNHNQQNRVSRSVKTVYTNLFEKNCKLHTFATTNSNCETINIFRHASSLNVHVYQFSAKSGHDCVHMHHPLTDIQADFEMNRYRYQFTAKRNY